jgi:hypothetical protein
MLEEGIIVVISSVYMYSICHYSVSDSVRHKNVVLLYVQYESIFVLYVTLCFFGGLNWNNKIIIIFIMM